MNALKMLTVDEIKAMDGQEVYTVPLIRGEPNFEPVFRGLGWHTVDVLNGRISNDSGTGGWPIEVSAAFAQFGYIAFDREASEEEVLQAFYGNRGGAKMLTLADLLGLDGKKVYTVPVVPHGPTFSPLYGGLGWKVVSVEQQKLIDLDGDGYWRFDSIGEDEDGFGFIAFDREVNEREVKTLYAMA